MTPEIAKQHNLLIPNLLTLLIGNLTLPKNIRTPLSKEWQSEVFKILSKDSAEALLALLTNTELLVLTSGIFEKRLEINNYTKLNKIQESSVTELLGFTCTYAISIGTNLVDLVQNIEQSCLALNNVRR